MKKQPTIDKMMHLSTEHLDKNAYRMMADNDLPVSLYIKANAYGDIFGFYVPVAGVTPWLEQDEEDEDCGGTTPESLIACLRYADDNGCNWIMFDNDVEPIDELPIYD